jgi:hypothetical protein
VACEDADVAFRTTNLLGKARCAATELGRDCEALLDRVHVEKDAVAAEMGVMMAGG